MQNPREEFAFILVGNVIDKHYYGENKEIRSGTKHFRSGAKIFLFPEFGGMGHENMPVYGMARKCKRKIKVVINSSFIKNVRVKKIYDYKIINKVHENHFYENVTLAQLENFALFINRNNKELV